MSLEQVLPIRTSDDAGEAPNLARRYGREMGFDRVASDEIALVVRELALNVLHHGGGGALILRTVEDEDRSGIEVEAENPGPPIPDVEEAFRDGHSTRGGFGYGLGTVNRKMHSVDVQSPRADGSGTRIVARRWLYPAGEPQACFLDAGVASRPRRGCRHNGDAVVMTSWDDRSLVAVIDGLGHGSPAMKASSAARGYIAGHARESLVSVFRGVDRACRGTRGVVMALVRFQWSEGSVTVGNVGNVEVRTFGIEGRVNFVVRRGFLGRRAPRPAVSTVAWPAGATMVLHTDGIRAHTLGQTYKELANLDARTLAPALLTRLHKDRDDGTVAVLRRRDG